MNEEIKFEAQIKDAGRGGAYVEIPSAVTEYFGTKGIVKIKATFDGYPYTGSLTPMGGGIHMIGILKDIRRSIEKQPEDFVCVTVIKDDEPRTIEIPEDLLTALSENPKLLETFQNLAFTHRKEHIKAILDSKRPDTRYSRIQKTILMIKQKMK